METHCTEHTDLKMNFKRLSNEANAKQLTLDKPPWQRAIGREDGGFLGQRSWAREKGWPEKVWEGWLGLPSGVPYDPFLPRTPSALPSAIYTSCFPNFSDHSPI